MNEFEEYLEKYAKKHNISTEEARQHFLVKAVERYYKSNDKEIKWWQ